jgi:hypothetical protein
VRAAAAAREVLLLPALRRGAARRGAEAAVHGWVASAEERIRRRGGRIGIVRGFGGKREGGLDFMT